MEKKENRDLDGVVKYEIIETTSRFTACRFLLYR